MIYPMVRRVSGALHEFRQLIKSLVYLLLLINFSLYIRNDWLISEHTLHVGASLLDWSRAFAVTIDESAWIMLLILFEMETSLLSDDTLSRVQSIFMQLIRVVCYVSLGHTLYAYTVQVQTLNSAVLIDGISNLCQLVEEDIAYAYNLAYTALTEDNCASLSSGNHFYNIDPPTFMIVQDRPGLDIEMQLAWVDLLEALVWLMILFTIEITIWLQDRSIAEGFLFKVLASTKFLLYFLLWLAILYWLYRGHYIFAWDEFVWISGFVSIEMNASVWRKEINEAKPG